MPFVVKAAPAPEAGALSFNEKTMYRGKEVRVHDEIFVFASDHQGGQGLVARNLGRRELKPFCDVHDHRPQTEIARKLYRQATNKIAGISDEAAEFLRTYF
jgi:hypothetical protein